MVINARTARNAHARSRSLGWGRRENVKPQGRIDARVQSVGPEHFAIICIDPHKNSSAWMLADFYGKLLIPPRLMSHRQADFESAIGQIRKVIADRGMKDSLVVIERTGQYHLPVRRAFQTAGFEVRLVHPYATKQYRQPADPGNKTDATDLAAMHRAATHGFALSEACWPEVYRHLQLLVRHRRDLVGKCTRLCCQIREHLTVTLPGLAERFDDFFQRQSVLTIVCHFSSATALLKAGSPGIADCLRSQKVAFQERTIEKVLAWAQGAALDDADNQWRRAIWTALEADRCGKEQEIQAFERQCASLLVQTPYSLLLALPGVNVVSAAELAGELGPITGYAHPNAITGRAGLCPQRRQSNQHDSPNGPLRRHGNRRLRAALMQVADNLVTCNRHFGSKALAWREEGKDPRSARVRIAKSFSRLAFAILAGGRLFAHPALQPKGLILKKLLTFAAERDMPLSQQMIDLVQAAAQLPKTEYAREAQPLAQELERLRAGRRRGPKRLAEILPIVLEKLEAGMLKSTTSEETGSS
jgi:transposase